MPKKPRPKPVARKPTAKRTGVVHMVGTSVASAEGIYKRCTCGWEFKAAWRSDWQHIRDAGDAVSKHLEEHSNGKP